MEIARDSTPELLAGCNELLVQLSSTATALRPSDLERIVANPAVELLVATDPTANTRLLGMLSLVVVAIPSGVRAIIEDVVVDGAARGRGVGAALVTAALARAATHGALTVDLTSRPERIAANRLYQRCGFERRETNVWRRRLQPGASRSRDLAP